VGATPGGSGGSGTGGVGTPSTPVAPAPANPSTSCSPSTVPGEVIHACAFPSEVAVVAVTSQYVAVATRTGRTSDDVFSIHRLDRAAGKIERIAEGIQYGSSELNVYYEPAVDGIVWLGNYPDAKATSGGIQTMGLASLQRRLLADNWTGPNMVTSPTSVYWDGYDGDTSGIFTAPLAATSTSAKKRFFGHDDGTLTFATAGGWVYYFASSAFQSTLERRPESGGDAEVLATGMPTPSELGYERHMAALDSDGSVYYATRQPPGPTFGFELVQVKGGAKTTIARCSGPSNQQRCPEPAWVAVRGNEVLMGTTKSFGTWLDFLHLPKTPLGDLDDNTLATARVESGGVGIAPPVFDGDRFWVGVRVLSGSEGRVVSRPMPASP
jgi:hypothetical protein